jgi:hypothetical protein
MACNCILSGVSIPPPAPACPSCLRAGSAVVACEDSVPPGGAGIIDVSELGEVGTCADPVLYQIVGFDDSFSSVTINASGVISFTFTPEAIPGTFPEIRFKIICPDTIFSSVGRVLVCVQNLCIFVVCPEGEFCNPETGVCEEIPPIINAGVD